MGRMGKIFCVVLTVRSDAIVIKWIVKIVAVSDCAAFAVELNDESNRINSISRCRECSWEKFIDQFSVNDQSAAVGAVGRWWE